jgi:hypothetical protein
VTLYDDPADDLFDGQLGEDDDSPPRLLLEYTVLGGKYTSLQADLSRTMDAQQSSSAPSHMKRGQITTPNPKKPLPQKSELKSLTVTIEYTESRAERVKGLGCGLRGKLVVEANSKDDKLSLERVAILRQKKQEVTEEVENL